MYFHSVRDFSSALTFTSFSYSLSSFSSIRPKIKGKKCIDRNVNAKDIFYNLDDFLSYILQALSMN